MVLVLQFSSELFNINDGDWLIWKASQKVAYLALICGSGLAVFGLSLMAVGLRSRHLH